MVMSGPLLLAGLFKGCFLTGACLSIAACTIVELPYHITKGAVKTTHKYLPLPTHVKVTTLENGRPIILRVNDRGPFPRDRNPSSGERILDVSARAAKLPGFSHKGLAKVQIEVIHLQPRITGWQSPVIPPGVPPSAFPVPTSASFCSALRGVWGGSHAEPCASPAAVRIKRGELLDRA
jgi:rare lipoprotein A